MKIIVSPAKKMVVDRDSLPYEGLPAMLDKTREIMDYIKSLSLAQAKALWACNDKIAELNFDRFKNMDLTACLTPAILAYDGIQYQYMAVGVMTDIQYKYLKEHLRILSGFYGVLSPFDGVVPYRLEMQAKTNIRDTKSLYEYWGKDIYNSLISEDKGNYNSPVAEDKDNYNSPVTHDRVILNLASKEYSKAVEPYLTPQDRLVTCVFGELKGGKVTQKATLAKMARGEMVNYLAEINAQSPEDTKGFDRLGFTYREELSTENNFVFVKE